MIGYCMPTEGTIIGPLKTRQFVWICWPGNSIRRSISTRKIWLRLLTESLDKDFEHGESLQEHLSLLPDECPRVSQNFSVSDSVGLDESQIVCSNLLVRAKLDHGHPLLQFHH